MNPDIVTKDPQNEKGKLCLASPAADVRVRGCDLKRFLEGAPPKRPGRNPPSQEIQDIDQVF